MATVSPDEIRSQVKILFDYWPKEAEWFVIGGPANHHEAQGVKTMYPDVKCVGFEPNKELFDQQKYKCRFPGDLHPFALWKENTELTLSMPTKDHPQRGSVCRPASSPDMPHLKGVPAVESYQVQGRTLDSLDAELGPWSNVVLWLDIEYAELPALQGAKKLLEKTLLINLESFSHLDLRDIIDLLLPHDLILYRMWNMGPTPGKDAQDYIFVKRQSF